MSYIRKTSIEGEQILHLFKQHWLVYLIPFILCFVVVGIFMLVPLWFVEYGVTNKRVVHKEGFIATRTDEMKLDRVETVELEQPILGRILGYGDVKITGMGVSDVIFRKVAKPFEVKKAIDSALDKM